MDRDQAKKIVGRFNRSQVAILGDLMLDHYVWGRVSRISPEAPVPVVEVSAESKTLGGAGNVAMNIRALGGNPFVLGVIGDDEAGRKIRELLQDISPNCAENVLLDPTRPSTLKRRVVAHSQHVVRVDRESRAPLDEALRDALLERLKSVMPHLGALIVSDYNKGVLSRNFFDKVVALSAAGKVPCFLDPKTFDLKAIGKITALTPNEREAEAISGIKIVQKSDAEKAGNAILEFTGVQHVLMTRGEHGMALFAPGRAPFHLPTQARQVFDVTGAGDTVAAVLGMSAAAGATMMEAAQLANLAAGIVVGRVGTSAVSAAELLHALDGDWPDSTDAPHPYR